MSEQKSAKIDTPLQTAIHETPDGKRLLTVFVHARERPTPEQRHKLEELSIHIPERPTRIFTATLSPNEVLNLSRQDWIKSIRLSQRLKALPD